MNFEILTAQSAFSIAADCGQRGSSVFVLQHDKGQPFAMYAICADSVHGTKLSIVMLQRLIECRVKWQIVSTSIAHYANLALCSFQNRAVFHAVD